MEILLPDLGFFFWSFVAFLITLFILAKFAWKPIIKSLNEREKSITESVQAAEEVKKEMAKMKSENEDLLAQARDERAAMLREAKMTKDKIINEAKEQAKQETNKIVSDAQDLINRQKMAAITELKNNVGKLVIEVSEKVLRRELSGKDAQESYIRELTDNIELN